MAQGNFWGKFVAMILKIFLLNVFFLTHSSYNLQWVRSLKRPFKLRLEIVSGWITKFVDPQPKCAHKIFEIGDTGTIFNKLMLTGRIIAQCCFIKKC